MFVCIGDVTTCNAETGVNAEVKFDCGFMEMHDPMMIHEEVADILCQPPDYDKRKRVEPMVSKSGGKCGYLAFKVVCSRRSTQAPCSVGGYHANRSSGRL